MPESDRAAAAALAPPAPRLAPELAALHAARRERRLPTRGINLSCIFRSGSEPDPMEALLSESGLWIPLSAACDPSGRQAQARGHENGLFFAFRSETLFIFCECGPPPLGTRWFYTPRDSTVPSPRQELVWMAHLDAASPEAQEIERFFDSLLLAMAVAHAPTMERARSSPEIFARAEAALLGAATPDRSPPSSKARL